MSKEQQLGIRLLEIGRGQVIFQVTTQTIHAEIPIQVEPDNPDEMVSKAAVRLRTDLSRIAEKVRLASMRELWRGLS